MSIGPNVVDDCEGMTEEDYWHGMVDAQLEAEPFCQCQNELDEEEEAFNCCKSCGKPIG